MNKVRATNKAAMLNTMAKHPALSYEAKPIEPTKHEKDRWQVAQLFNGEVVGVAMT
jgi:hypothetical protein